MAMLAHRFPTVNRRNWYIDRYGEDPRADRHYRPESVETICPDCKEKVIVGLTWWRDSYGMTFDAHIAKPCDCGPDMDRRFIVDEATRRLR